MLFKSDVSVYPSIKFNFCQNTTKTNCKTPEDINALTDFGRIFLFVEQTKDDSSISKDDTTDTTGNNYLQYNFFLLQEYYKRVTISFQVVRT